MKQIFGFLAVGLTALALSAPVARADSATDYQIMLDSMNARLEAMDANVRVQMIEWLTDGESGEVGSVVFANDRGNKQLGADWVPFDPSRTWNANSDTLTYLVDQSDAATDDGLTAADTEPAIDRAMDTWNSTTPCSNLAIVKVPDPGTDPDIVDGLLGFGSIGGTFADITHGGWVPAGVFSPNTIGITFTLVFVSGGVPTDINNDGKADTALREIYYNDRFVWQIDGDIDVETVALHESGHGLSQAHFGKISGTLANGKIHFSPRAVMNAAYSGVQQSLTGTDNAGHCSIWGNWPNN